MRWIQLQPPLILAQTPKIPNKINHHQFIVASKQRLPCLNNKENGIAIYDTHTNQWKLLAKYPTDAGYNIIGDTATYNMHQTKLDLTSSKRNNDTISVDNEDEENESYEVITFDVKTREFYMAGTIADNLCFCSNGVSVNKSIIILEG